jgi:hypothetical protein
MNLFKRLFSRLGQLFGKKKKKADSSIYPMF